MKRSAAWMTLLLLALLLASGCKKDNPASPTGISDVAKTFADSHWDESAYRQVEYDFAIDPNAHEHFDGTQATWESLTWIEKINYLPDNFTQELPLTHTDTFYNRIGNYPAQFGFGWDDAAGDQTDTPFVWDGSSDHLDQYLSML